LRNPTIDFNIEAGSIVLHDGDGRSRSYRRVDGLFALTTLHAIFDRGCMVLTPLLDADGFPKELFVKHDSPQQPPQGPVGIVCKWAGEFRYVRED
jgi:hypothetical protein